MLASISSATLLGVRGSPVRTEVHVGGHGLPGYRLVGQPDTVCRESRDRVRAAVMSSALVWPDKPIVVNLAPSGVRKSGAGLDLAIAVGVLVATAQLPADAVARYAFLAELGLDGTLRRVPGVAPMVDSLGHADVVIAPDSVVEARLAARGAACTAPDLRALVECLLGERPWDHVASVVPAPPAALPDLADVRGQPVPRHALEVSAAGGHHLLLVGSPGSGKTMLAQRLPGLLPSLTREQALETTMAHSASGLRLPAGGLILNPPFRAPHHTSSTIGLVGGGSHQLRPGEVTLAHNGVLFLDELGEFARSALEALREPLEEGVVRVTRANDRTVMPARFLLVAATNPCPCGGGPPGACECDEVSRTRYLRRLSGPLSDRFDLRVVVHKPAVDDLLDGAAGEPSAVVRERVVRARAQAIARAGKLNGALQHDELDAVAALDVEARALLRHEMEHDRLTGRGYHRVRRVARTLADLAGRGNDQVVVADVELALSMRSGLRPAHRGASYHERRTA